MSKNGKHTQIRSPRGAHRERVRRGRAGAVQVLRHLVPRLPPVRAAGDRLRGQRVSRRLCAQLVHYFIAYQRDGFVFLPEERC